MLAVEQKTSQYSMVYTEHRRRAHGGRFGLQLRDVHMNEQRVDAYTTKCGQIAEASSGCSQEFEACVS